MVLAALKRLFFARDERDPFASLVETDRARLRIVVGLGNPGEAYADTRHNVGFQVLDRLASRLGQSWTDDRPRTRSLVAVGTGGDTPLVLAKPQTFMNESGQAIVHLLDMLGVETGQILVVYDDMDLPVGSLRVRVRGSAGTHNGMRSVLRMAGTSELPRLRIGIGQAGDWQDARDYVLSAFSDEERGPAEEAIERGADAALTWARQGAAAAMNAFNT